MRFMFIIPDLKKLDPAIYMALISLQRKFICFICELDEIKKGLFSFNKAKNKLNDMNKLIMSDLKLEIEKLLKLSHNINSLMSKPDFLESMENLFYNEKLSKKMAETLNSESYLNQIFSILDYFCSIEFTIWEKLFKIEYETFDVWNSFIVKVIKSEKLENDKTLNICYNIIRKMLHIYLNFIRRSIEIKGIPNIFYLKESNLDLDDQSILNTNFLEILIDTYKNNKIPDDIRILSSLILIILSSESKIFHYFKSFNLIEKISAYLSDLIKKEYNKLTNGSVERHTNQNGIRNSKIIKNYLTTISQIIELITSLTMKDSLFLLQIMPILINLFYVNEVSFRIQTIKAISMISNSEIIKIEIKNKYNFLYPLLISRVKNIFLDIVKYYKMYKENNDLIDVINDEVKNLDEGGDDLKKSKNIIFENLTKTKYGSLNLINIFFEQFYLYIVTIGNLLVNNLTLFELESYNNKDDNYEILVFRNFLNELIFISSFFDKIDECEGKITKLNPLRNQLKLLISIIDNDTVQNIDLIEFYNMFENVDSDNNLKHKITYVIRKLVSSKNPTDSYYNYSYNDLMKFVKLIINTLFNTNSDYALNRECLIFLEAMIKCSIINDKGNNDVERFNYSLWIKADRRHLYDFTNKNQFLHIKNELKNPKKYINTKEDTKYLCEHILRHISNPSTEDSIFNHSLGINEDNKNIEKLFLGTNGVKIGYKEGFILKDILVIENQISIAARIFNSFEETNSNYNLLQSQEGLGSLFCVDKNRRNFGILTEEGIWLDSGIDLNDSTIKNSWIHIVLCILKINNRINVTTYLNGRLISTNIYSEKVQLSNNIKFIGNSKDLTEPFGLFCDLRIIPSFLNDLDVISIFNGKLFINLKILKLFPIIVLPHI